VEVCQIIPPKKMTEKEKNPDAPLRRIEKARTFEEMSKI